MGRLTLEQVVASAWALAIVGLLVWSGVSAVRSPEKVRDQVRGSRRRLRDVPLVGLLGYLSDRSAETQRYLFWTRVSGVLSIGLALLVAAVWIAALVQLYL